MKNDSISDFKEEIYTCNRTRCGYCRTGCPIYEELKLEAYNCRGKMLIARGILEGTVHPNQELIDTISLCANCGYCEYMCALNNSEIINQLKSDIVKSGYLNLYHKRGVSSIEKYGNPFFKPNSDRSKWVKKIKISNQSDILFFAGCSYSYNYPKYLISAFNLLNRVGVELNYLGKYEGCCGILMQIAGLNDSFQKNAESITKIFKNKNIKKIIVPCPACYKIFKNEYPKIVSDFNFDVYHTTTFLLDSIENSKLKFENKDNLKVTYHDPCDLARGGRIIEEPRKIIQSILGIELIEMENNKYNTRCCGGGGDLLAVNAEVAMEIAKKRIKEAEKLKVDSIITSCATCEFTLNKAIRLSNSKLKILDINDLLLNSIKK